ncbi:serine hydrolase [Kitasatospora sp. NPDC004240]
MARTAVVALAGAGLLSALAPAASATGSAGTGPGYRVVAVDEGAGVSVDEALPAAAGRGERAALDAAVRAVVEQGGASAALALVREDGRTVWKGAAGRADLRTGAPATADGRFRIGSVTKTFVATVVLQLVAEHRIGLDDPIERHLPGTVPGGGAITVRQLLNHTSGLYNYLEDPAFDFLAGPQGDPAVVQRWLTSGRWTTYRPQQLVDIAFRHDPYFAPGQGWRYSNTNYVLVGMLIEKVTGRGWAEEVERRIIRPLGLRSTSMPTTSPFVPGPHAHGYFKTAAGPADVTLLNPSMADAAGAGISTTADLARFDAALLGGRLLGPAELAEMKRTVDSGFGIDYGLGLMKVVLPCGEFWGHGGGIPGYGTTLLGDGRRQFAASYNPYDESDPEAAGRAVDALTVAGLCGPQAPGTPAPGTQAPGTPAPGTPASGTPSGTKPAVPGIAIPGTGAAKASGYGRL